MPETNMSKEQIIGTAKKYALEFEAMTLVDHTCIVNILLQLCQRRQAMRVDEINSNIDRTQQEAVGAPHLVRQ